MGWRATSTTAWRHGIRGVEATNMYGCTITQYGNIITVYIIIWNTVYTFLQLYIAEDSKARGSYHGMTVRKAKVGFEDDRDYQGR